MDEMHSSVLKLNTLCHGICYYVLFTFDLFKDQILNISLIPISVMILCLYTQYELIS